MTQETTSRPKRKWPLLLLLILIAGGGYWYFHHHKPLQNPGSIRDPWGPGVVEVFRTPGGILEVGGLTKTEDFYKENATWRGTTASQVRVEATYRYGIVLPDEWRVTIRGNSCLVIAPVPKPTLPVGFDTNKIQEKTESGWGRFDKNDNLTDVRKSISSDLAAKANSKAYNDLVRDQARKTVEEFITTWLLREQKWPTAENHVVKVYFADETSGEGLPQPKINVKD